MTSSLATNAQLPDLGQLHYLKTDRDGVPLQKQVPVTNQVYTGAGNETVIPNGSEVFFVNSTIAAGVLTIGFTTAAAFRNYVGRKLKVVCLATTASNIVIDSTGQATMYGPNGVGDQCTITAGHSVVVNLCFCNNGATNFITVESVDALNVAVA